MKVYKYLRIEKKRDDINKILNEMAEKGFDLEHFSGSEYVFSKTKMGPKKKSIVNAPNKMLDSELYFKK